MILDADIRQKLLAVESGRVSLDEFEDWLADAAWGMHRDSAQSAIGLASAALMVFDRRDAGFIDDGKAFKELAALLIDDSIVQILDGAPVVPKRQAWRSSSSAVVIVTPTLPSGV